MSAESLAEVLGLNNERKTQWRVLFDNPRFVQDALNEVRPRAGRIVFDADDDALLDRFGVHSRNQTIGRAGRHSCHRHRQSLRRSARVRRLMLFFRSTQPSPSSPSFRSSASSPQRPRSFVHHLALFLRCPPVSCSTTQADFLAQWMPTLFAAISTALGSPHTKPWTRSDRPLVVALHELSYLNEWSRFARDDPLGASILNLMLRQATWSLKSVLATFDPSEVGPRSISLHVT